MNFVDRLLDVRPANDVLPFQMRFNEKGQALATATKSALGRFLIPGAKSIISPQFKGVDPGEMAFI